MSEASKRLKPTTLWLAIRFAVWLVRMHDLRGLWEYLKVLAWSLIP